MFVGAGSCVGVGRNSSTIPIVENLRGVILYLPLSAPFNQLIEHHLREMIKWKL
jgi:hypothetical protein